GRTFVVLGMLEDKPIADVMSTINPIVHHWYLSTLAVPRGATAETLRANLESIESAAPADLYRDPLSAYQAACKAASERDRIVVFGSFFTVSDILSNQQ
ncbi:MAG: bifunctional folylpolyglutamate synthase/dihydrofolate synthase, partial [Gammaproteobacteria bacterium]|nr:bifunctional folylpolyglutamate synthase/dihydrofolate synthase [Gammaproteobacteria bacterium]